MAKLTIDLPDKIAVRVIEKFCARQGYDQPVRGHGSDEKPNELTKEQFMEKILLGYIKHEVRIQEEQEEQAARRSKKDDLDDLA